MFFAKDHLILVSSKTVEDIRGFSSACMPNEVGYNEPLLLADLREGSVHAFEKIFKKHWEPLYQTAKAKLRSHDEAEEVIQSIFSQLWERRQLLAITNLEHYLHTAVRNRILNIIRNKIQQEKYWAYYADFMPSRSDFTEEVVALDELSDAVACAVDYLPEKSRRVFRLSRIEGRSNSEIAGMLNVSEKAIEYHVTKSLKQLRLHLKDFISLLIFSILI